MRKIFEFLNNLKYFSYYIVTPLPYAIGTAAWDILFAIEKSREKKKKLLIIVPRFLQKFLKYSICNSYLFDQLIIDGRKQKDFFIIRNFLSFILGIIFFFKRIIALFFRKFLMIKLPEHFFFLDIGIESSYYSNEPKIIENDSDIISYKFFKTKNNIEIEDQQNEQSLKILSKFGINKEQPYVCLHVREGLYRNDINRRAYRNSNIENYYELIKFLCKKNIYVIRIGRISENKIKIRDKLIIDLPFLDCKKDFLDLFLIKNCNFFIGDQSGPTDVAMFFNKDCLKTNMVRIFELGPVTAKSRSICKIPFFKNNKKLLNLNEYLELPYLYHHGAFINEDLDFVENSSEELYFAIKEYYSTIFESNYCLSNDQILFNKKVLKNYLNKYLNKDIDLSNYFRKHNILRLLKSWEGSYSSFFLKNHFN